jgi:hypothetical protein
LDFIENRTGTGEFSFHSIRNSFQNQIEGAEKEAASERFPSGKIRISNCEEEGTDA